MPYGCRPTRRHSPANRSRWRRMRPEMWSPGPWWPVAVGPVRRAAPAPTARSAVVRQLPAVETLGAVTVVAADKTGTLTEGVMLAERFWTEQAEYFAEGNGYDPGGSLSRIGEQVAVDDSAGRLLRDVVLCND